MTTIFSEHKTGVGNSFLPEERLAQMIDVSAVRADSDLRDVRNVAKLATERCCIAAFSLPSFCETLVELLSHFPDVRVGGVVGFPGGGETTAMKSAQARELIALGCSEIDMVINIGKMLSGDLRYVENDVASVKQTVGDIPLKVILECHYFDMDQIREAAECCVRAGADWVKTGTGWAATPTTLEQVRLLKQTVGDDARVKAAGGVRNLDTLLAMHQLGAERFGIGYKTASAIFEENANRCTRYEK